MKIDETIEYAKYEQTNFSKEYRLYREKWKTVPFTHEVTNFPLHLDIEINTTCNLHCTECPFHSRENNPMKVDGDYMPLYLYKQIIDEGAEHGLRAVKLNYRGEPLMHPNIVEMVKYAKDKGIVDVMFNTNGLLLTPFLARDLITAGLDQIFLSIDDHRAEIYNKLRDGGDFQRVFLNLITFKLQKDIMKANTHIRVSKIDFPTNNGVHQEFEKKFGPYADSIGYQHYYDYFECIYDNEPSHYECAYPWQRMMILVDGTIQTCCNGYDEEKTLGHFPEMTLYEAWHSSKFSWIRKMHQAHHTHLIPQCCKCIMRHDFK